MLLYELFFIKRNPLFVFFALVAPALSLVCFKLFFDSALQFGYSSKLTQLQTYFDLTLVPENVTLFSFGPSAYLSVFLQMQ
jgi:hypothetical protein